MILRFLPYLLTIAARALRQQQKRKKQAARASSVDHRGTRRRR